MQAAANPRKLLFALLLTVLISSRLVQSSNLATSPSPSPSPSPAVGMPTPNDHGVSKGKGIVKKETRGSYPATCHSKCNECEPCMPVQVSIRAMVLEENEYRPQVWRCACGDSIFSP
ncbi:EPIDERMAL PATTERNING FACTOR-like protein 6 [Pyrus x bretschneideri]|uniref:EPIDERMAL PATTERNING FACTOR-like protein 6 n=1 Tax=Pyrus x bretschneideri TaxID=225117 RepID=UPI00202FC247|nr:EPIDERMAL PATTERNING FACTOR-like protein 6 [Pyrus x bretschneideri]